MRFVQRVPSNSHTKTDPKIKRISLTKNIAIYPD